jgi:transposase
MQMIRMDLSDEQRRELQQVSRQAVGHVALRAQMVLLCARGYRVPQIAQVHDCGEDVVRLWLHRYRAAGIAGLADEPRSGRPPKDRLAAQIVDTQAGQSPECSGHARSFWTVATLTAFLLSRFRLALSRSSVRRYLKATGWRWARPRLAPARKVDPAAPAKLAALAAAAQAVAAGAGHLLYLDECDLHLLPTIRAMWMKGPRLCVPTPGQNAKHAFFGALEARSGRWLWVDHERKRAVHFVAFLDELVRQFPTRALYLALDNAPIHTAKVVQRWLAAHPRVQVLWLPKYGAHDVNPAERIWGFLKTDVAANRLAGTMAALVEAARRCFHDLPRYPVALPQPQPALAQAA